MVAEPPDEAHASSAPTETPTASAEMAALVPDASVAAKWFLDDEEHTAAAQALLARFASGELSLVVPDCFFYELARLIQRAERRGRITAEQADQIMGVVAGLLATREDSQALIQEAFSLARAVQATVYDAMYLVVAERWSIPFVTADDRLFRLVAHLPYVRRLGD